MQSNGADRCVAHGFNSKGGHTAGQSSSRHHRQRRPHPGRSRTGLGRLVAEQTIGFTVVGGKPLRPVLHDEAFTPRDLQQALAKLFEASVFVLQGEPCLPFIGAELI